MRILKNPLPQASRQERTWLLTEKYAGNETEDFVADVARLTAGEPLAYVIGHIPFLNVTIDLSHRPLIPRTETEHWVGEAIRKCMRRGLWPRRILDLFSGSGCIGIALARAFPDAQVDLGEYDTDLLAQIEKNIILNNIDARRTRIIQTDVFSHITDTYDYIFANPPYIPLYHKYKTVEQSVRVFEPEMALYGGEDGLKYIKKLITKAPDHLALGGTLFVEFDTQQKESLETLTQHDPRWSTVHFVKDQYGTWRVATLIRA
ncbi:MAG: peptide chain release factor N(5)-glutamine methyltransferase [Minisyncoccota bacterium]